MHWVHSQVIVPETSPFFCSSELGTHPGVHRVSALYGCCVWVCMGVPVSNRYQCAPRIYDAAPKTVEFLSGRVSVSFWPWQWSPGKVTWWAAGTVVLSQGAPYMSQDEDVNAAWTILPDPSRDQVSHLKNGLHNSYLFHTPDPVNVL